MIFNPKLSWEFLTTEEIVSRSIRAMRNHVKNLKEISPYYRDALSYIDPSDIRTVEDIAGLPLTDKKTLGKELTRFWSIPAEHIVETVITSGSTGDPLIIIMSQNDLDRLSFNEALSFHAAGVKPGDRAQIMVSLDRLIIAGMAYYRGLTTLGVNTARIGVLDFDMQMHYLQMLKPTVIVGVPSFFKKLGLQLSEAGFDPKVSSIKKIFCIGESLRDEKLQLNSVGKKIEELFNATVYSSYGVTELAIAFCECTERTGNHAHPELIYTEVVDDNGKPVADGSIGELVATPLGVDGVPLLRYRTGDLSFKIPGSCACGRNSDRIGPIVARKSQLIKLKGISLYPQTIINVMDELDFVEDYVIILEGDESLSDQVFIHVVSPAHMVDTIATSLRAKARVAIPILVSNNNTINYHRGNSRKKIRVVDKRAKKV